MPIDTTHSQDYKDGWFAYEQGQNLADKPLHYFRNDWDAGWHDALAKDVRALMAKSK